MDWRCGLSGRVPAFKCKALNSNPNTTKKEILPRGFLSILCRYSGTRNKFFAV
jgi:hypothetical protein